MSLQELLHATTVAIGGRGVLISGPSGAGKSDLALRLIDRGAVLVSDDRTLVSERDGLAIASAPASIAGKLEVRGLGIATMPTAAEAPLALCVALASEADRLPPPRIRTIVGVVLPETVLDPHPASAALKVELMLAQPDMAVA